MRVEQTSWIVRVTAFLSISLGLMGLLLCAVYEAQRAGLLFQSLSRFVQHHLEGFAGWASVVGIVGVVIGFLIRSRGGNGIVTCGIMISLVASLWAMLGLPL
jgi:uncharacterized membrane protein HdeD (DUF308 family)